VFAVVAVVFAVVPLVLVVPFVVVETVPSVVGVSVRVPVVTDGQTVDVSVPVGVRVVASVPGAADVGVDCLTGVGPVGGEEGEVAPGAVDPAGFVAVGDIAAGSWGPVETSSSTAGRSDPVRFAEAFSRRFASTWLAFSAAATAAVWLTAVRNASMRAASRLARAT
jgi:hypothetical protein